jgi:cytochrome c-type biogenesis protein CcmH
MTTRLRLPSRLALAALLLLAVGGLQLAARPAHAQSDIEAQALRIERQLLCPQCTNLRLDVCETQICIDMRGVIRQRLAQGQSDQQIIDYFTGRYGERVLADLPREGFNLVLFGWVGASVIVVAVAGTLVLLRLRRTASPAPTTINEADDRWLDEQLARETDRP